MSEINKARMHSDMQAIKIAKMYANDDLLKYLPIPRLRLPNVELNVPVLISEVNTEKSYSIKEGDKKKIISEFQNIVSSEFEKNIKSSFNEIRSKINKTITDNINEKISLTNTEEDLSVSINSCLTGISKTLDESKIIRDINENQNFLKNTKINMLKVLLSHSIPGDEKLKEIAIEPETAKIKEIGDKGIILNLKLSISENAVEWVEITDSKGNTSKRLVPE